MGWWTIISTKIITFLASVIIKTSRTYTIKCHSVSTIYILFFVTIFYHISQQTFVGLQDVLKTSSRHVLKMSSTRLQCNNFTSSKTSSRRLQHVLEDEKLLRWRRLQDVFKTCLEDVLMTWRRLEDISWRRLQDVLEANKMFTGDICI